MAEATAFVGYKEYPHIDTPETGARAMQILVGAIKGEITPTMAHVRLPLIAPNQSMVTTWQSPLKIAIDRARESNTNRASSQQRCLAASLSPIRPLRA